MTREKKAKAVVMAEAIVLPGRNLNATLQKEFAITIAVGPDLVGASWGMGTEDRGRALVLETRAAPIL